MKEYRENQRNLYKSKVIILIFTDQIMNKYLYTIILNIVYKSKSTYVIVQNNIINVEIIALNKCNFTKYGGCDRNINQHELSGNLQTRANQPRGQKAIS